MAKEKKQKDNRNTEPSSRMDGVKSVAAALAVAFLLYVFTFFVDGEMGIILMAFIIFAPLISLAMALYARKRIRITIDCDGYVQKGSSIDAVVTVEKTGVFPLAIVEICPRASEVFGGWDKNYRLSLAMADKKTFVCPAEALIGGNGELSIPVAYSCGFLGFMKFRLKEKGQLPESRSVGVIPPVPEIKTSSQLFRSIADIVMTSDEEENDTALLFSANTSPGYEHREYVEGDPLKRVNWKLSSKKNKMMVRLDEAVASVQPTLALDLYRSSSADPVSAAVQEESLLRSVFGLMGLMIKQGISCTFIYRNSAGETVCENVDHIDSPSQLLMKVLAVKVKPDERLSPSVLSDQTCACVIASTNFTGDFTALTDIFPDSETVSLIAPSPDCINPTAIHMWYLDGENNFKMV
ncbi:MAG TPA: hypothetical protein DCZ71_04720 [Ruminococcus sp.]|nr:hypothetical protein [Ruminococcus sp.]